MLERLRLKLTYANVMATLAMFAVLGGGAYAAATIGAGDIKKNAVRSKHIKKNAVKTRKIADGAVTRTKLAEPGFTDYEYVETTHNVQPGDTSIVTSASCPEGKKLLGGGFAVQDSKFHVTFAHTQENDVYGLTAVVLPGQTITGNSQAFVKAICARVG